MGLVRWTILGTVRGKKQSVERGLATSRLHTTGSHEFRTVVVRSRIYTVFPTILNLRQC